MQRAGTLIGDEMGLGKTIQAIGVANGMGARRILIVCPASLKLNWRRELATWMIQDLPVHVVEGGKAAFPDVSGGGVVVVNYDLLHVHAQVTRQVDWDLLVADEAHYLKDKEARRTRAVFGGPKTKTAQALAPIPARRRLLLTGTPANSRPAELFTLIHYLDPQAWPVFFPFALRYCNAHKDRQGYWDYDGSSNEAELQERLRASVLVRRLKAEVLTELPPKVRQVLPLPADTAALRRLLRDEQAAHDTWERLRDAKDAGADAAFDQLSRLREQVGLAKAPLIAEHILQDAGPVVAFGHHRSVVDAVAEALAAAGRRVVRVTGDMRTDERQTSVDRFQDGRADVILGTLGAMGVGLTLTRSSHVVIGELDWVPATISQAEDRCHRIGQVGSVHVEHLVFEGSLDSRLVEVLIDKQRVLDAVLDAQPADITAANAGIVPAPATAPAIEDLALSGPEAPAPDADDVLAGIEAQAAVDAAAQAERRAAEEAAEDERRAARAATDAEVRARLRAALDVAGWGLSADDHARAERLAEATDWRVGDRTAAQVLISRLTGYVERAAGRVGAADVSVEDLARVADPGRREVVLRACQHLSVLDADRATEENGIGWDKANSWTGHWIAGHDALDEQAAAVALGLLRRHHRQLDQDTKDRLFGPSGTPEPVEAAPAPAAVPVAVSALEAVAEVVAPEPEDEVAVVEEEPEAQPAPAAPVRRDRRARPRLAQRARRQAAAEAAAAERMAAPLTLALVGEAAYGPRWQTDMARAIGVAERTVRRWDSGETPMPPAMWRQVEELLARRAAALDAVLGRMRGQAGPEAAEVAIPGFIDEDDGERR